MKAEIIILGLLVWTTVSFGETISATVENVYNNAILLNWKKQKPIYGQSYSDGLQSEGNFLGVSRAYASSPAIIGYKPVFEKEILIIDYPTGGMAEGQNVNVDAKEIGTTNFMGKTIELWDGGIIPKTQEQMAEMKVQESIELAAADQLVEDQRLAVQRAQNQKIYEAQERAVKWLQSQATNGDAGAECSLGEHYLNGQGCDTNRQQGIYWLQKAADQGDIEASNCLANLKK